MSGSGFLDIGSVLLYWLSVSALWKIKHITETYNCTIYIMKFKKIKHHLCLGKIDIVIKATFLQVIGIDAKTQGTH